VAKMVPPLDTSGMKLEFPARAPPFQPEKGLQMNAPTASLKSEAVHSTAGLAMRRQTRRAHSHGTLRTS
jgi:hypothetical protein